MVGTSSGKFNIENMKEYDITDKLKNLLKTKDKKWYK